MKKLIRTERGWAGHFICAYRCTFHRNTLLEYGDTRIVVSTVGRMGKYNSPNLDAFEEIGHNRYYETMVFYAELIDNRWWDADVDQGEIPFDSPWAISEIDAEDKANDMHEKVVNEIIRNLKRGKYGKLIR